MDGSELILIVIGLAILLVIFALFVKFFRQIMLALAATAILGIGAFALITQGRATEETAKAAKTAATAATVASAGQTANTMILAMLSGVLIVVTLVAVGGAGYFFIRAKRVERKTQGQAGSGGKWTSGPNALWGRADAPPVGDIWAPVLMGQLMALQQTLLSGRAAPPPPVAPRPNALSHYTTPALGWPSYADTEFWASDGDEWEEAFPTDNEHPAGDLGDLWAVKF